MNIAFLDFDHETVNKRILDSIQQFPDSVRKEVRLLSKQYELLEVFQEPINETEMIQNKRDWFIRYKNFCGIEDEFIWRVKSTNPKL